MEHYVLNSAACLACLLLFYKLLLEKESFHAFKRYYLLASLIVSGIIPLITFYTYVEINPTVSDPATWSAFYVQSSEVMSGWFERFLWYLYFIGVTISGGRFLWNLHNILQQIKLNQIVASGNISVVLLQKELPPHTFWNYIFLNKQKFQNGKVPREVLEHEKAHALQWHSIDILLLEILQIFLWFNPLIYLLKNAIKLNHEFLADREVLRQGITTASYQNLLLSYSSADLSSRLVHAINYSIIKKRFTVMKATTNKTQTILKMFLILPVLALLLYSFSTKETLSVQVDTKEIGKDKPHHDTQSGTGLEKRNPLETEFAISDQDQEKVTPRMLAEYNQWAKRLNGDSDVIVKRKTIEKMKYIFSTMTPAQRKASEPFPNLVSDQNITVVQDQQEQIKNTKPTSNSQQVPPPPPPPAPPVPKNEVPPTPAVPEVAQTAHMAPPPPPPSPLEAMEKWIEEDAKFYYNGKPVSSEEALKVVRQANGKNLNVQIEESAAGKIIRLSDQ